MASMNTTQAISIIESLDPRVASRRQYFAAWQHLVNTGVVWELQGWYGRTAMAYIEKGLLKKKA